MASPLNFFIPGTFYKIADGPLDVTTKNIQVIVDVDGALEQTTVSPSDWSDLNAVDMRSVISGSVYYAGLHESGDCVFVCDNAVLNDYTMNFGGEMPFTGIFVSEGVESIIIPEGEEVHQIESKYLPTTPTTPSVVFNDFDGYGTTGIGCAHFAINQEEEVDVSISDGSVIFDVYSELLYSKSESPSNRGGIAFDNNTGKVIVYPGASGDVTTVNAVFIVAKYLNDTQSKAIPTIVTIQSGVD